MMHPCCTTTDSGRPTSSVVVIRETVPGVHFRPPASASANIGKNHSLLVSTVSNHRDPSVPLYDH
jgi:hypothetical protein